MQDERREAADRGSDLSSAVGRLAQMIEHQLGRGDVAALRRLTPENPGVGAFWKVAAAVLADSVGAGGEHVERRWTVIVQGMAVTSGFHAPGTPAGAALAEAGYSELRFTRLLRAHDDALASELRGVARYLASKAAAANWTDLAALVLSDGGPSEETVRRSLARNYYRQLARAASSEDT